MRSIDFLMVWKFVSVPPSQRLFTWYCLQRSASDLMASCACFFVPTKSTLPPRDATSRTKSHASRKRLTVCWRSMMWMPLRAPKM
jgi:hypothetical protein